MPRCLANTSLPPSLPLYLPPSLPLSCLLSSMVAVFVFHHQRCVLLFAEAFSKLLYVSYSSTIICVLFSPQVTNTLKGAIATGVLPHLLFYGPPGTGKTSTVLALARTLYGPDTYK